jgi:hypothetical protein
MGAATSLPARGEGSSLEYYVTNEMPAVPVPVTYGAVTQGQVALYLPWGSGPDQAGLAPGVESTTSGPSSFDVGADGSIVLADALQSRVAVFRDGALVRESHLSIGPRTDVALAGDGGTFVVTSPARSAALIEATKLDPSGEAVSAFPLGVVGDQPSELRTAGNRAYLHLLPLDAWLPASADAASGSLTGRPLADGSQLLKVVNGNTVRLARVVDGEVRNAVELVFDTNIGEIALAEPDGKGGYWTVVHVWQELPTAADQYQVVHVDGNGAVLSSFAAPRVEFAETMPLSTFRLGGDGDLYQLTSSSDGVRVVRYDLGGVL